MALSTSFNLSSFFALFIYQGMNQLAQLSTVLQVSKAQE